MDAIVVKGAREHNLKGIDVTIPRDRLVVITGLSGSGKSSLAFDTLYAEGQRRYVESLSTYARQFLGEFRKAEVESIEGLSPAIAIEQRSTSRNPRSTVGTLTEIYDYLRLLYARVGVPHCYNCGKKITAQSPQRIVDMILALPQGTKFLVLSPLVRGRKGEFRKELTELRKQGFARVRVDGELHELAEEMALDKNKSHTLEVVVDRLVAKPEVRQRATDAVELALRVGDGLVAISVVGGEEQLFSERFACLTCGISYPEMEPRLFSFNSPHGACTSCSGLGQALELDPDKIIPDPAKSLAEGAIEPWNNSETGYMFQQVSSLARHYKQSVDAPWKKLGKDFRQAVLYGTGTTRIAMTYERGEESFKLSRPFEGVIPNLTRRLRETASEMVRDELQKYLTRASCALCKGARLRPEARAVRLGDKAIHELCSLSVSQASPFVKNLPFGPQELPVAEPIVKEIEGRLKFLSDVGLDYLSLDRPAATLSGGEAQRIRLATQVGSALRGVMYVLDEPSIGLHQRDNARLLTTLARLRDLGNSVIVVEHDEATIRAADWVIDMGPGAGVQGGEVVVAGPPDAIVGCPESLTGDYLSGRRAIPLPRTRRKGSGQQLRVCGARGNNLRHIDVALSLGTFTCVTGVSGSGKSTLVHDTLYRALANLLNGASDDAAPYDRIEGLEAIDKVIAIDQSPIGRTPRSNPATYTGLFALIRDLFAGLPESRTRGYKAGRYSFNVKGGRCEACQGDGLIRIEMHFLPDVYVTCVECQGRRYNRETLEVHYKGKSIADVLDMTVEEALSFLGAIPPIRSKLETLRAVGMGYVQLGQSATTLSGGEAQRVKLSRELARRATGRTLYILDEPTTGLHFHDVARLLEVLQALVEAGNTVLVIEHNLDVIKSADCVIDLGPEGGEGGGAVVATGTPEDIAKSAASHTAAFLRPVLERANPRTMSDERADETSGYRGATRS